MKTNREWTDENEIENDTDVELHLKTREGSCALML